MIDNPVPWPNGARCAVAITFDMDADSLMHYGHPRDAHTRVSGLSMLRYGPEVAMRRILATYDKFGIKQTFFIPAWCIESYPDVIDEVNRAGHEIAFHGYIHEDPNSLGRKDEAYWLQRSIEVIKAHTGQCPRGARAPLYNFSRWSTDLLIDSGIRYDASLMGDDIPYVLQSDAGELIEIPSHWGLDDWPQYVHSIDLDFDMPIKSASEGMKVFQEEFDAMWEHRGMWISVWHPFVTGRLARWCAAEKLIEYMLERGDIWFARMEDIAAHVRKLIQEGSYVPRVDEIPYYDEPISINR